MDTATAYHHRHIEAARSILTHDALRILHPGPVRSIIEAVDHDLAEAIAWRLARMGDADALQTQHEAELERAETAAHYVGVVRDAIGAFGPAWRHTVPQAAWTARRYVHLAVLEAEHNPVALARVLDRIYGLEGVSA